MLLQNVVSEPSLNMDTAGGLGRMFFDERLVSLNDIAFRPTIFRRTGLADRLGFSKSMQIN